MQGTDSSEERRVEDGPAQRCANAPRTPANGSPRGDEPGRGRSARSPIEIPARGWKDVLLRVKQQMAEDRLSLVAAGVAFFAILALFPTLIAAVSLYGLLVSPEEVQQQIASLSDVLPEAAREVLRGQLSAVVQQAGTTLSWSALFAVLAAFWSASSGTDKLVKAIGITYDEPRERGFLKARGMALLLTLGFLIATAVALGVIAVLPTVRDYLGLDAGTRYLLMYGRWPLLAAFAMVGLSVLYNVAPPRHRPKWRWVTWGSALTTLLWIGVSVLFSVYVQNFGSFGETYGALAGFIVLMLWTYLSVYVILIGAELNAEMEAQTKEDSTVGPERPMGERNAEKADHLGAAHG